MGDQRSTPAHLIVSTIVEAENIVPLLKEYQAKGRHVDILFSFPVFPSAVARLAAVSAQLGPGSLLLMIDHADQVPLAAAIKQASGGHAPLIFIKIDGGYGRAGVVPASPACSDLLDAVLAAERAGDCFLHGLYIHAGHSYGTRQNWDAMHFLAAEFVGLSGVAAMVRTKSPGHPLVLSVGATPTATTIQHPDLLRGGGASDPATQELERLFVDLKGAGFALEIHAGVYTTLDIQQLATHARDPSLMSANDIAISVLAEVASVYPGRGASGTPEALINTGCLALGREPVADKGAVSGSDYSGWGIPMPWGPLKNTSGPGPEFPRVHGGWQLGRISQEHGILVWKGGSGSKEGAGEAPQLRVGDRVRVWPNHSCIAGSGFERYLIVDSRNQGREDEIVDVWPRWRGW